MPSKTPKRAQEIRDLARALCILAWRNTDWSKKQIWANSLYHNVEENTVERVWLAFPSQGTTLNIQFSSSMKEARQNYSGGHSLLHSSGTGYYANGEGRIQQIWWKMAKAQKSFSGMGLLGTKVEVLSRPSEEAVAWAESIVAPYGISPEAGIYEVSLQATATVKYKVTNAYPSPDDAARQARAWIAEHCDCWRVTEATDVKDIQVTKVEKTS